MTIMNDKLTDAESNDHVQESLKNKQALQFIEKGLLLNDKIEKLYVGIKARYFQLHIQICN